jgi:hypothetical protein
MEDGLQIRQASLQIVCPTFDINAALLHDFELYTHDFSLSQFQALSEHDALSDQVRRISFHAASVR